MSRRRNKNHKAQSSEDIRPKPIKKLHKNTVQRNVDIEIIEEEPTELVNTERPIAELLDEHIVESGEVLIAELTPDVLQSLGMKERMKTSPWKTFIRLWSKTRKEMGEEAPIPILTQWGNEVIVFDASEVIKMREEMESGRLIGIRGFVARIREKLSETHPYAKVRCSCKGEFSPELDRLAATNSEVVSQFMDGVVVYLIPDVGIAPNIEQRKIDVFRVFSDSGCKCRRTSVFGMTVPYTIGEISTQEGAKSQRISAVFVGQTASVSPGEKGIFYGFWALKPVRTQSISSIVSGLELKGEKYEAIFVVLGFDKIEEEKEEDIETEELRKVVEDPWFEEKFIESVFPDYFGFYFFKKALVLSVLNGTPKEGFRENVHVLAITDPGVGKTTAFQRLKKVAPKATYISGSQSTKAGLVASLERTEDGWEIVAGALVSASGGVAIIDEIDKLPKDDIEHLHEVMEEQEVHINKASIRNVALKTKVSIVAGGNPKYSRFDPRRTIAENIDLPTAVLNRFDLIFAIRSTFLYEIFDEETADELMREMVYFAIESKTNRRGKKHFNDVFIKKFLTHAKSLRPEWTSEARSFLESVFAEMMVRNVKAEVRGSIAPTQTNLRVLNSLIRLAEANAKLHLREKVLVEDVQEAVVLLQMSHLTLGIISLNEIAEGAVSGDPEWKKWKFGRIVSKAVDDLIARLGNKEVTNAKLKAEIRKIAESYEKELAEIGRSPDELVAEIERMIEEGKLVGTDTSAEVIIKETLAGKHLLLSPPRDS